MNFRSWTLKKVLSMCLIHDLGELYAGDIPAISNTDPLAKSKQEYLDICRIFQLLPEPKRSEFLPVERIQQLLHPGSKSGERHWIKQKRSCNTIREKIHRILIMHSISLTEPPTSKAIRGWRN